MVITTLPLPGQISPATISFVPSSDKPPPPDRCRAWSPSSCSMPTPPSWPDRSYARISPRPDPGPCHEGANDEGLDGGQAVIAERRKVSIYLCS